MHNSIAVQRDDNTLPLQVEGDRAFGLECMRRGLAALCIEQRSFGERRERKQKRVGSHGCHDATMHALMLGRTLVGLTVPRVIARLGEPTSRTPYAYTCPHMTTAEDYRRFRTGTAMGDLVYEDIIVTVDGMDQVIRVQNVKTQKVYSGEADKERLPQPAPGLRRGRPYGSRATVDLTPTILAIY